MNNIFKILVFLWSLAAFSQNLACCKDVEAVKNAIKGDWKLKEYNENLIYRFSFFKDKGFIEVLGELNLPPKAEKTIGNEIVIDDHTIVEITYDKGLFFIDLIYLYGKVSEQILVLNDETFIYGKGESQHTFVRDKN